MNELKVILTQMVEYFEKNQYTTEKYNELYFEAKKIVSQFNLDRRERRVFVQVLNGNYDD